MRLKVANSWLAAALVLVAGAALAAPQDTGIVLLHGKWGAPRALQGLARTLESQGYRVATPEMAWSGRRLYDVDYPAALREIEKHVEALHAQGATRIVVGGQSLGANAVLAYAASGLRADALVLLAPGHVPEFAQAPRSMGARIAPSVAEARRKVAGGEASATGAFLDVNQGRERSLRMSAATYLSYFDPEGLGAMTRTIRRIAPTPIFLAVGRLDPFLEASRPLFESAPAHPASHYVVLAGDHFGLAEEAGPELVRWLEATLP